MKRIQTLCFLVSVATGLIYVAQTDASESTGDIEKTVLGLEEAGRLKFLKGEGNWDDLIADGAYMVGWDGKMTSYKKGEPLPASPMKSMTLSDLKARVYSDMVVVTGLGEGEIETPDKKSLTFESRFLNVWKKTEGTWKIVVTQSTPVRKQPAKSQ